jgi:multidrug efflux pump subunit AcrB
MTFKMYQNRGEVAIGLSEDEKARIEAEQAYFIKEDVEYQKRIAEVNKQLTKTDDALFLINDIKGKLNAQGAYGGGLNTLSQFIGNAKATGKFLFGVGDKKISVDPKDTKNPTFRTVDPDFDANFADIKKAILDPDEYINSVVNIGNEKRIMTEAEKERFRGATRLFRQEFANVNAALQTNIIQLAYAIAKANEEGGRFSVSDIEFAMQSIGNGSNLEQFNSKLNTVAARVAANAYKRADGLYTEMSNVKRDYIRNTAEEKRKNDVFKRIEKNYRFYLGKDEDPDDRKSSDVPNLEQRLQQRQKNKGP